jgi:hypothetical protein
MYRGGRGAGRERATLKRTVHSRELGRGERLRSQDNYFLMGVLAHRKTRHGLKKKSVEDSKT